MLAATLLATGLSAMAADAPKVKFATTAGDIVIEVYPDKAPKTVDNFLKYVESKHYNGTIFHRVIGNFMIQGGGYDEKFYEKPTRPPVAHEGEVVQANKGPRNTTGTIAMARTNDPNSATAQFFINVKDNASLDYATRPPGYVAFGKVVSGMDVVDKIKSMPTGAGGPFPTDVPKTAVVITSATIVK
nr:peptidylprolyl isomerase [Caenimonas koreensis]